MKFITVRVPLLNGSVLDLLNSSSCQDPYWASLRCCKEELKDAVQASDCIACMNLFQVLPPVRSNDDSTTQIPLFKKQVVKPGIRSRVYVSVFLQQYCCEHLMEFTVH